MNGIVKEYTQSIVNNMICLSKGLADEYVNMFAKGAELPIQDVNTEFCNRDVLFQGMMKKRIIEACEKNKTNYYYMDSGYIGNYKNRINPSGWKVYHRIVKNSFQHSEIIDRPEDRWLNLEYTIRPRQNNGRHILLVVPSDKPCKYYGVNQNEWVNTTVNQIKKHTDRPVEIRYKQGRKDRRINTIFEQLDQAHALVTLQSIAAVESVLYGVPAFTLAPTAADPVCDKDLALLENPTVQDEHKIYKWACHLAYGQVHISEMRDGTAYTLLKEHWS